MKVGRKVIDLAGQTFGSIRVLKLHRVEKGGAIWRTRCLGCQKVSLRTSTNAKRGNGCKSCAAKRNDWRWCKTRREVSKLYSVHRHIIDRCCDPDHPYYKWYGGRGITIHEPWKDFWTFFAALPEKDGPTFDRIDNSKGYEPGNLRWATMKEQSSNRRPRTRKLNDETVAYIKRQHAAKTATRVALAAEFNVSLGYIHRIVSDTFYN